MMKSSRALAGLAGLGAILAASRGAAEVNVNINIGAPPPAPIVIAEPPRMLVVPRTTVYYAPSVPYDFFYHHGRYYAFHGGAWFWSASVHGPWGHIQVGDVPPPILTVPIAYYKVHHVHWKKHRRGGPPPWAPAHGHRRKHHRGNGHPKHHDHDHHDD